MPIEESSTSRCSLNLHTLGLHSSSHLLCPRSAPSRHRRLPVAEARDDCRAARDCRLEFRLRLLRPNVHLFDEAEALEILLELLFRLLVQNVHLTVTPLKVGLYRGVVNLYHDIVNLYRDPEGTIDL